MGCKEIHDCGLLVQQLHETTVLQPRKAPKSISVRIPRKDVHNPLDLVLGSLFLVRPAAHGKVSIFLVRKQSRGVVGRQEPHRVPTRIEVCTRTTPLW